MEPVVIDVHGVKVTIPPPRENCIYTDAVLIVRSVHDDSDGGLEDNVQVFQGDTPGTICTGMVQAASQMDSAQWHRAVARYYEQDGEQE